MQTKTCIKCGAPLALKDMAGAVSSCSNPRCGARYIYVDICPTCKAHNDKGVLVESNRACSQCGKPLLLTPAPAPAPAPAV